MTIFLGVSQLDSSVMHGDRTQISSSNNIPRIKSVYENLEDEHRMGNESVKEFSHPIKTMLKGINRTNGEDSIVRKTNHSKNNAPKRISLASLLIECEDYLGRKGKPSEHDEEINVSRVQESPRDESTGRLNINDIQGEALYSVPKKNSRSANDQIAYHQRSKTLEAHENISKQKDTPVARETSISASKFNEQESNCTNLGLSQEQHPNLSMTSTRNDIITNREEITYESLRRLLIPENNGQNFPEVENVKYPGQPRIEKTRF